MILEATNIRKKYGNLEVLKGVSLQVKKGEIVSLVGPSGAGKSTLGNVLSGREGYEVTGGSVEFNGKDLFELEIEERARAH